MKVRQPMYSAEDCPRTLISAPTQSHSCFRPDANPNAVHRAPGCLTRCDEVFQAKPHRITNNER